MRRRYTECVCDNCYNAIGHYVFDPIYNMRKDGAIVSKYGDFCSKECLIAFKKKRKER